MILTVKNRFFEQVLTLKNRKRANRFLPEPVIENKREFSEFYRQHYRKIYNLCFQVTKNKETAEDITVKVFAQFYEDWNKPNAPTETPAAYVRSLAVSRLVNHLSRGRNNKNFS